MVVVLFTATGNGSFLSKPLLWNGGELIINADTVKGDEPQAGSVTIYVLEQGRRTPPSLPFYGNTTNTTIEWPSGGDMDSLTGKTIQLAATLTGAAKLYALRGDFTWAS